MVNLSEAKSGDVVHFRCGGSAEIEKHRRIYLSNQMIHFAGIDTGYVYENNGLVAFGATSLIDIVKVESK